MPDAIRDLRDVRVWGPAGWTYLHAVCFGFYTNERPSPAERRSARRFVWSFAYVLPCQLCRAHFLAHLVASPPAVHTRDALARWSVDAHNAVNVRTGKPALPFDDVARQYGYSGQARSVAVSNSTPLIVGLLVGLVVLIVLVAWSLRRLRYLSSAKILVRNNLQK